MSLKSSLPRSRARRAGIAAAVAATAVMTSVPAFADSGVGLPVTVATAAGTRQFAVESVSGSPLTALDLGQGGSSPFRVRVSDNALATKSGNFSVSAVLNNLYQVNSTGNGYAYNVSIPSSAASISYPTNALAATGLAIPFDPTVLVSGLLPTCAQLNAVLGKAQAALPAGLLAGTPLNVATDPLCAALGTLGSSVASVDLTKTLQKTLSDVLSTLPLSDLPINLATPAGGAFTKPDFSAGSIGAADTTAANGAAAATPVTLLTGNENITSTLSTLITNAFANIPLVGSATTQGLAQADDVLAALRSTATPAEATLLALIAQSTPAAITDILNNLTATLDAPSLNDILNLTGSYLSFPSINVTPPAGTPVGTYRGTMTVTYLQK